VRVGKLDRSPQGSLGCPTDRSDTCAAPRDAEGRHLHPQTLHDSWGSPPLATQPYQSRNHPRGGLHQLYLLWSRWYGGARASMAPFAGRPGIPRGRKRMRNKSRGSKDPTSTRNPDFVTSRLCLFTPGASNPQPCLAASAIFGRTLLLLASSCPLLRAPWSGDGASGASGLHGGRHPVSLPVTSRHASSKMTRRNGRGH
jgi:hypothetical protein